MSNIFPTLARNMSASVLRVARCAIQETIA
jgi:hypothetical protein